MGQSPMDVDVLIAEILRLRLESEQSPGAREEMERLRLILAVRLSRGDETAAAPEYTDFSSYADRGSDPGFAA